MNLKDLIPAYFADQSSLAKFLEISPAAVSQWKGKVPPRQELRIRDEVLGHKISHEAPTGATSAA